MIWYVITVFRNWRQNVLLIFKQWCWWHVSLCAVVIYALMLEAKLFELFTSMLF